MTIHCRDFERVWNEKLDVRGAWSSGADRALEAHAEACPACRALDARYRALARAIVTMAAAPPALSAGFTDRVLASASASDGPCPHPLSVPWRVVLHWVVPIATAAALLLAVGLGPRPWRAGRGPAPTLTETVPRPPVRAIDSDDLGAALVDATSATLFLAREASAPAARVGREVLAEADFSGSTPALGLPEGVLPAAVFRGVGERVNAGVRPLSGTARSAFGFLLGAPDPQGRATPAAPPRGA